ncbi:hypothetical protein EST38_g8509 [Candolleomyces aberdarensis]|uniref:F-box domain-containing protein n=1 Tax=Candolleomyces aberdarensis TaxID=2316362 RepID=A0A4Q2DCC9_9AGAR|nr:hypothetical protein EST38_g8509 [Candolleomyces aberdarensis]
METVLQLPDLLTPILQHFRVLPPNSDSDSGDNYPHFWRDALTSNQEKRTTLYRLALTNKAISQIALPILWSTLGGVAPLLGLIPGAEFSAAHGTWALNRGPLCEKDLLRFEQAARMVKHITILTKAGPRWGFQFKPFSDGQSFIFFEISRSLGNRPLLPSLQSLCVDACCDYASLLLVNTLKHVDISSARLEDEATPAVQELLSLLPTRAPLLEELYICCALSEGNLRDVLSLEYLQKLTLDFEESLWPVNHQKRHQFLKDLDARLPRLRKLDLGTLLEDNDHKISPWLEPGLVNYHFPSLENLAFSGGDDYLAKVLLRLRGVGLKSLVFLNSEPHSGVRHLAVDEAEAQEIEKFSAYKAMLILGEQHFRTLTRLEINGLRTENFHPGDLDPLFRISGMKHLDFHYARNVQIDDELISKMASSWPHLETLRLYSDPTSTCPTLASIEMFARHCPNLRRLSLDLDPGVVPLEDTQTILPLKHLTLFSVLSDARIGDDDRVSAIAKFLSKCFPALMFAFVEPSWDTQQAFGELGTWSSVFDRVLQDKDAKITERLRNVFSPPQTFPKIDFVIADGVGGSFSIPL